MNASPSRTLMKPVLRPGRATRLVAGSVVLAL